VPIITRIAEQKRNEHRRSIYVDGAFAFAVNLSVIAKFSLHVGQSLTAEEIERIGQGEQRQKCFDKAIDLVSRRPHGRDELRKKLARKQEWGGPLIDGVLDDLTRLNYLNDARFATQSAEAAAGVKRQGRNRAMMELLRKGVGRETARHAVEKVYEATDSLAIARDLARRKLPSLKRLEPAVAKRRLYGVLLRRGFEYETVRPVVDEVLGGEDSPAAE
jgi:regulatory protein